MMYQTTVIVNEKQITNISRYGDKAEALVATSEDHGRNWSEMRPSNLPMATSKPIAGMLSTGQRYLVCTTTADRRTLNELAWQHQFADQKEYNGSNGFRDDSRNPQ